MAVTDFSAGISITNPSPVAKQLQANLPSNYTRNQTSNVFAYMYGTGQEIETLKQTIGQMEANNYIYSPSSLQGQLQVNGAGVYLIEFDIPFVLPPLNVNVSASAFTDVYIEYTSRFGMTIKVETDPSDTVYWTATGSVGAASNEYLGDGLYNNFGALLGVPRFDDTVIDNTWVNQYAAVQTFLNVTQMLPVQDFSISGSADPDGSTPFVAPVTLNAPPSPNALRGQLQKTSVVTNPNASYQLIDANGNILALLSFTGSSFPLVSTNKTSSVSTSTDLVSGFLPANLKSRFLYSGDNKTLQQQAQDEAAISTFDVYVAGNTSSFTFDAWDQPSYQQEVFVADNKYRRILSGLNRALSIGPNLNGISTVVETLLAQPYIPSEIWESSDFRIFNVPTSAFPDTFTIPEVGNTITINPANPDPFYDGAYCYLNDGNNTLYCSIQYGYQNPLVITLLNVLVGYVGNTFGPNGSISLLAPDTQFQGTPGPLPYVQVNEVLSTWTPETLTYASRPITQPIKDVTPLQITTLNSATSFDLTTEVIRQLRVGIDEAVGGILDWNYLQYIEVQDANEQLIVASQYNDGVTIDGETFGYNFAFLNSTSNSIANLILFYYQAQYDSNEQPTGYQSYGPLVYGRDFYLVNTADLYDPTANNGAGGYNLPAELLVSYNANSVLPFIADYGDFGLTGQPYIANTSPNWENKPSIPSAVLQIDLTANRYSTSKFPQNISDLLIYSYGEVSCIPGTITGNFQTDPNNSQLIEYCDSRSGITVQPSDSTFIDSHTQLSMGSYARFQSATGYQFVTTMVGGQITFNKTVSVNDLLNHVPNPNYGACGIPILKITLAPYPASGPSTGMTYDYNFFQIQGVIVKNTYQGNPYYQIANAQYLIVDEYDFPVAIISPESIGGYQTYLNDNTERIWAGVVSSIIWDTRMPATDYQDTSPVYQVSNNFDAPMTAFAPDIDQLAITLPVNTNFLALINAIPLGNQQTVTASWTFNILQQVSNYTISNINGIIPSLPWPDIYLHQNPVTTVQTASFQSPTGMSPSPNPTTVSLIENPTVGNTLIALVSFGAHYSSTLQYPPDDTWTQISNYTVPNGSSEGVVAYKKQVAYSNENSITLGHDGSGYQILLMELTNVASVGTVTSTYSNTGEPFSTSTVTANESDMVIAFFTQDSGIGVDGSPQTGWTEYVLNQNGYNNLEVQTIVSPSTKNYTGTWGGNGLPSYEAVSSIFVVTAIAPTYAPGIMTYYTGTELLRQFTTDPDNATYQQMYTSPAFSAYFIGYKDLLNTNYGDNYAIGGGKLGSQGDYFNFDTVFNSNTTPANMATILNFFNPQLGIFSLSVLPGMEFYNSSNNTAVNIIRPRNLGISLSIQRDSYAGLVFYGQTIDENVDKPTRLLMDFSYGASQNANRHRVLEIDDNDSAGWVDGLNPNDTMNNGSTFYIAGNMFKYSADGYDQAPNAFGPTVDEYGNLVPTGLLQGSQYSLTSTPPVFEVSSPSTYSDPGEVQRYRRPPVYALNSSGSEIPVTNYYNITPEKIAFFNFDLDSMPIDTLLNSATLEVHFCSGFTIRQGDDKNFTLSYNNLWKKSRLSGNGKTQITPVLQLDGSPLLDDSEEPITITRPLNNVHWRKNFFEILIPYAFVSDFNYDFSNIFNEIPVNALTLNTVPPSTLEYVGFINLDEIGVAPLAVEPGVYIETTQGLSNILLSQQAVIWQVSGTLHSDDAGNPNVSVWVNTSSNGIPDYATWLANGLSTAYRYYSVISQNDVLPNMKVIVFPFGIADVLNPQNSEFIYGYVTSVLPSSPVGFAPKQIASYKQLLQYIVPLYAEYNVKLLESDTYFPFTSFGGGVTIENTAQDTSV